MSCKQQVGKLIRRRGGLQIAIALAILLASATVANASALYYIGGIGDWSSSNWTQNGFSPHSPPANGDTAYVGNNGVVNVSLSTACDAIYVGHNLTKPGTGTVNVSSYLTVGSGTGTMHIGSGNVGTVTQSGGGVTIGGLVFDASGGTYNING